MAAIYDINIFIVKKVKNMYYTFILRINTSCALNVNAKMIFLHFKCFEHKQI